MAQVIFGAKPKTFAPIPVKFLSPEGKELTINAVFKYRTTKEYGALLNDLFKVGDKDEASDRIDFEELFAANAARSVDSLLKSIDSWDVPDHPVSKESLTQLAEEIPAAVISLGNAYRSACIEGRLGN